MNRLSRPFVYVGILMLAVMSGPTGCSTDGAEFDTSKVGSIVKGTTTKNDARKYFGDPLRIEDGPTGEVWTYTYVNTHTTGAGAIGSVMIGVNQSESTMDTLILVFDGNIVKDYEFSNGSHTDTYNR